MWTPPCAPTTTCTASRSTVAANRALRTVLDQFTPVLRRAERLRFSARHGQASVERHAELIRLCAAGDAAAAAAVAFDTFHSLPVGET